MRGTVKATIAAHRLIAPGDHVVAAVSGGADSVCLARVLSALRDDLACSLSLLHVHHGIRGEAADADEAFVAGLAKDLGLAMDVARVDVPTAAKARGVSLEMAGRDARLRMYRETAAARGAAAVAVGHTRSDRVETFLFRLLRGSGGGGLSGMRAVRQVRGVRLIRPLLDATRPEVEHYLISEGQSWREDQTNTDDQFVRNRIRHELVPLLRERFHAGVDAALYRVSRLLEEDETYLSERAAEALSRCRREDGVDAGALGKEPPALAGRVLMRWLMDEGVPGDTIDLNLVETLKRLAAVSDGSVSIPLPGGGRVERVYGTLRVRLAEPSPGAPFDYRLDVPGQIVVAECGLEVVAGVVAAGDPRRPGRLGEWPAAGCLNRTRVGTGPLTVRSRGVGDRMRPLGLGGTVTLQDVFVDAKVPRALRDRIPVVACRDEIVWIPGYRVAEGWEVRAGDPDCIEIRVRQTTDTPISAPPSQ